MAASGTRIRSSSRWPGRLDERVDLDVGRDVVGARGQRERSDERRDDGQRAATAQAR